MAGCLQRHCFRCLGTCHYTGILQRTKWRCRVFGPCTRRSPSQGLCLAGRVIDETSLRGRKNSEVDNGGSLRSTQKPKRSIVTFQEVIAKLQTYWGSVGCAIWQPHNSEVGAGTMNPATFLRVIGPEPWQVCYVEPSVRPDDSRYGENPNRLQQHTQLQVILKPEPGNPQELYLSSLKAIGIDTKRHDIRFVEDNWENPALGAWGLGWEVWLDGQEITQFTYFQQAGGQVLDVPSVEITYGLERILTTLQGVSHFRDIQFNENAKYGDIFLQQEYEMSRFNLDLADIQLHQQLYELIAKEAQRLIHEKLPIPAYQQLLKLSHCFNILDARGSVGMTQRAQCFRTMRQLARDVAELWLLKRAELHYPLGKATQPEAKLPGSVSLGAAIGCEDLTVELGCEDLPPADIRAASNYLRDAAGNFLKRLRLEHGQIAVHSTPRRLVLHVTGVAANQRRVSEKLRGPPAKVAYDADQLPTKALLGFCKKHGVSQEDVFREADAKGVEYAWVNQHMPEQTAVEVSTCGAIIENIPSHIVEQRTGDIGQAI